MVGQSPGGGGGGGGVVGHASLHLSVCITFRYAYLPEVSIRELASCQALNPINHLCSIAHLWPHWEERPAGGGGGGGCSSFGYSLAISMESSGTLSDC